MVPPLDLLGQDALRGDCPLTVRILLSSSPVDTAVCLELCQRVLRAFVEAGRYGAFAAQGSDASTIEALGAPELTAAVVTLRTRCVEVDPAALQLLRNMVLGFDDIGMTADRIEARAGTVAPLPHRRLAEITDLNESAAYPALGVLDAVGEFVFLPSDFAKSRRALVAFEQVPRPEQLEALKEYADRWYQLLEQGAFCQPFGSPAETASRAGVISRFDVDTVEVHVSRYVGSESGFKILASMLNRFSRRVSRIRRIEID